MVDGDDVFVSGTTGYDYAAMSMPVEVSDQARNIFKTIAAALAEARADLRDVVRLRTFVTRAEYCEPVLKVQGQIFETIRPAASIYIIAGLLRPEMKVEIEATARIRRS